LFCHSRHLLVVVIGLLLGGLVAQPVGAAPSYYVVDLGSLNPAAPGDSYASAINYWGQVVGRAGNGADATAFLWNGTTMVGLGTLAPDGAEWSWAKDINNAGQVVGNSGSRAFLWDGTAMTEILDLYSSPWNSGATAINDRGQIVGWTRGAPPYVATLWQNGVPQRLYPQNDSRAYGINNRGQVVGWTFDGAFLWDGTATLLPSSFPSVGHFAGDINDAGHIVGRLNIGIGLSDPLRHIAQLWDGVTAVPLGFFLAAGTEGDCCVIAINNRGEVVGADATGNGVFWDGTPHALSDLLDASAAGWTITAAADINDRGQIAATALGADGFYHAVRLDPTTLLFVDIKPGDAVNRINPKSKGKIPVAILSTPAFDAPARIDPIALTFGRTGDETSLAFCEGTPVDANGDGLADLVCHFYTEATGFQPGDLQGVMKAKTASGVAMAGSDAVSIVPQK